MDDITIETEEENVLDKYAEKSVRTIWSFLEVNGWLFLITTIIGIVIYHKYVKKELERYWNKKDEETYREKYHKDSDTERKHREKLDEARKQFQERYEEQARIYAEKLKEKEEKIKEEKLKLLAEGGTRLGGESSKESYRPEYNPLMGSGGGTYKPPRRSCCSRGGGCG